MTQIYTQWTMQGARVSPVVWGVGLVLALALAGFGLALAQENTMPMPGTTPAPMVIETDDAAGNVVLRGSVTNVGDESVTIDSWGGLWTLRITDATTWAAAGDTISGIDVGDFIGVEGRFATDAAFTIEAAFVRNWTTDPIIGVFDQDTRVSDLENAEVITYSGVIDFVGGNSFTFTDDFDSTYTVTLDSEVGIVDTDNGIRSLNDLNVGDRVELDGVASGDQIGTDMVRILSQ